MIVIVLRLYCDVFRYNVLIYNILEYVYKLCMLFI